jgi:hypothetical protein
MSRMVNWVKYVAYVVKQAIHTGFCLEYLIKNYHLRDPGVRRKINIADMCYEAGDWNRWNGELFMKPIIFRIPWKQEISSSAEQLSAFGRGLCCRNYIQVTVIRIWINGMLSNLNAQNKGMCVCICVHFINPCFKSFSEHETSIAKDKKIC